MAQFDQVLLRPTAVRLEDLEGHAASAILKAGTRFRVEEFVDGYWIVETERGDRSLEYAIAYQDLPEFAWDDRGTPQAN